MDLNKKFIENGVCRFAAEPVLYPLYNGKNFMFGFIVKTIDVNNNTLIIDALQNTNLNITVNQPFTKSKCSINGAYSYISKYLVGGEILELKHLFYDFSSVIA